MKRTGFKPHFAAAVEATASTGGQIMPPIMGAAAFVMAEFQGVSYAQVVIWATIPAILYYVACFAAVHFEAKRQGLLGVPRSELPRAAPDAERARAPVHSGAVDPVRHVFGLQRAAGGAGRHAAVLPGRVVRAGRALRPAGADRAAVCVLPWCPTLIPVDLRPATRWSEAVLFTALISLWLWAVRGKIILLKIELRPDHRCPDRRRAQRAAGGAGLRLRRHHHRHRHPDRPRHHVHAVGRRPGAEHAAAGAAADHGGRHRARHGHADDAGLHHHDGAAGAGADQARRRRRRPRTCSPSTSRSCRRSRRRWRSRSMPRRASPSPTCGRPAGRR